MTSPLESTAPGSVRRVPWRAVVLFVVLACGLAWLVALPLGLGDGLAEPFTGILLPLMMLTPALAVLIVTFAMRVPAAGGRLRFLGMLPLRPAKRVVWFLVLGWLAPPVLVVLSILLAAALGFIRLDLAFSAFAADLERMLPDGVPLPPIGLLVVTQIAMIPVAALINAIPAFGEELGWRGWLLPALRPLGTWPALLLSGAIWGLWHSPVILLGYNFGRTDLSGVLLMVAGCVAWGVFFGWLRLRSASVWPAVIAHGSLNASAGLVLILAAAQPDLALAGALGVAAWIVLALVVLVLQLTGQFRQQPELAGAPALTASCPARDAVPACARVVLRARVPCRHAPSRRRACLDDPGAARLAEAMDSAPAAWAQADRYLADTLVGHDPALEAALDAQRAAGLPAIEVAPVGGKLLNLLARMSGATRVLEIGTLGGYSTIWLARAVGPEGRVVTVEAEAENAAVARASIDAAGVGERVDIRIGRGADVLPTLVGGFDLVFIDADKESNTIYLDWAAKLGRPGTVIVLDNIGREGEIVREDSSDPKVIGTREGLRMLGEDPRFDATALQTVGVKGWDGVALALVV